MSESTVEQMMALLPKSAEAWRVCGSRSADEYGLASVECVLRYDRPVSQRWVSKLPVLTVSAWLCDGHMLADRARFIKLKWQDKARIEFYKSMHL